jgi:hypothetical protein
LLLGGLCTKSSSNAVFLSLDTEGDLDLVVFD